jgi:hypothetical protein
MFSFASISSGFSARAVRALNDPRAPRANPGAGHD